MSYATLYTKYNDEKQLGNIFLQAREIANCAQFCNQTNNSMMLNVFLEHADTRDTAWS